MWGSGLKRCSRSRGSSWLSNKRFYSSNLRYRLHHFNFQFLQSNQQCVNRAWGIMFTRTRLDHIVNEDSVPSLLQNTVLIAQDSPKWSELFTFSITCCFFFGHLWLCKAAYCWMKPFIRVSVLNSSFELQILFMCFMGFLWTNLQLTHQGLIFHMC